LSWLEFSAVPDEISEGSDQLKSGSDLVSPDGGGVEAVTVNVRVTELAAE
jgi:hypothetical protein